jgi:hypothetical protein
LIRPCSPSLRGLLDEATASELDAAREPEIERRLAEYDQGVGQSIEAEEVFVRARRIAR